MNTIIQSQLDRVDTALNSLITSIESYNPSVPAAIDLLVADDGLQQGVKLRKHLSAGFNDRKVLIPHPVAQHQTNHSRILRLRSAIEAHDQQIRSTLTLLAETRKDLLSTPITRFPEDSRNVPFTELLDYAAKISRYTVPPTFREPISQADAAKTTGKIGDDAPVVNGIGDAVAEAREANAIANGDNPRAEEGKENGVGVSSLEPGEVDWLNELARTSFVPWPTEQLIKRGALGQIQVMVEQGVNPEVGGAAEEVARRIEATEEEQNVQMGEGSMEAVTEAGQRKDEGGERNFREPRKEEKPKVFKGLDLDEDSDDD